MRRISGTVLLCLLVVGCSEKKTGNVEQPSTSKTPAAAHPGFDVAWSTLAQRGVEALYIEDDRGQGLMGNVRRASTLPIDPLTDKQQAAIADAPLPEQPAGEDVQRTIKQNLAGVKSCYLRMSREGVQRSGKAIVSFEIGADGAVAGVKVDAPQFAGTALPGCVTGLIARWAFPKSQKGGLSVSYPFVFLGG